MIEFEDVGFRNPLYLNSKSPQKSKEALTTTSIEMEAEFNLETSTTSPRFSYHYGGTSSTSSINKLKKKVKRENIFSSETREIFLSWSKERKGKERSWGTCFCNKALQYEPSQSCPLPPECYSSVSLPPLFLQ